MLLEYYGLNNILFTPIIIIFLIMLSLFGKRYLATTNYFIINVIFVVLIIPFQFYNDLFFINSEIFTNNNILDNIFIETQKYLPLTNFGNISTNYSVEAKSYSWEYIFNFIWILGSILYFLFQIISYLKFHFKAFRFSHKVNDIYILSILEKIKKEQKIKRKINIRYSYFIVSPILINCFRPTILLPYNISKAEKYLYYIIKHELMHYKYYDLWFQRFRLLLQCLYWINPFVWILCFIADKEMERACDYHVSRNKNREYRKKYADSILYVISLGVNDKQMLISNFGKSKKEVYFRVEDILKDHIKKKGFVWTFTVIWLFVFVIIINSNICFAQKDINPQINNAYVPLNDTLNNLGFKLISKDDKTIEFIKGLRRINFINEDNFNLKKNNNTYYSKVIDKTIFIKVGVLKDLGYKISDDYCVNNIELDTELFSKILDNNFLLTDETDLPKNKTFYGHNIIKSITETELKDYSIEDVNLMNYNIKELEDYIRANYKTSLKQYKNDLISINTKYPSNLRITYDLLDNEQIKVVINTSDGYKYVELAMEVRNGEIFLEK